MRLAAQTLVFAFTLKAFCANAACMPSHNISVTVDITSCKGVTFHERQYRSEPVNVHDIDGTLLGVQTHSVDLLPHAYAKATDPVWLRRRFPVGFEVSVFLPEPAEKVCQGFWKERKNRVIVPIQTCCDTLPHRGICAVPNVHVPVKLEPIEPKSPVNERHE